MVRQSFRCLMSSVSSHEPYTLKFSQGFYFVTIVRAGTVKVHVFNFCEYVACLVLRPVADKFEQMQTNSRNPRKIVRRENFNGF